MTSAQLEILPLDSASSETEDTPFALKEQVAERLAAHRARHPRPSASLTPIAPPAPAKARAARIAATVAERYAHSPSYRAFLAAEAERAIHEAEAAAQVAALNAHAVAEAQNQLLFELDQFTANPESQQQISTNEEPSAPQPDSGTWVSTEPTAAPLTIRFYEEVERTPAPLPNAHASYAHPPIDTAEAEALDEEIAFRQSPVFEDLGPTVEIPANLIEFPRQLVAARKARPRLAEGPLREEADHTPEAAQLRIFEVEATQISTAPVEEPAAAPEWSSILLSARPESVPVEAPEAYLNPAFVAQPTPLTAPLSLRLMAGIVDAAIVFAALLVFIATFAYTAGRMGSQPLANAPHLPPQLAILAAAGIFFTFALIYQFLFFTFSEATPGMRYARIGLCTFSDDNPTRAAMRRRILAVLLSACPLGIGFLWAWLDEEGLGWHDRISRMYQRSY
jgi:uncharacterized RDD family membrane protein YckC